MLSIFYTKNINQLYLSVKYKTVFEIFVELLIFRSFTLTYRMGILLSMSISVFYMLLIK